MLKGTSVRQKKKLDEHPREKKGEKQCEEE